MVPPSKISNASTSSIIMRSQIGRTQKRAKENHLKTSKYCCCFYLFMILIIFMASSQINQALLAEGHIVLTKDDHGQSLVLTGQDGKGGKGGKGGGGDQLVIAGNGMGGGGGQSSNMVMQDAGNREGDVVINGNSMIIPGEDGHIVLADSRSDKQHHGRPHMANQMLAFWLPYMSPRMAFQMMPFLGGYGGAQFG